MVRETRNAVVKHVTPPATNGIHVPNFKNHKATGAIIRLREKANA
jgi:hypothetical protein